MKTFLNEIKENETVDSVFLVRGKFPGVTRTGNPYLKLKLMDRSGEMEARVWTSVETCAEAFDKDDFVRVRGKAISYMEHLQINITKMEKVEEKESSSKISFQLPERTLRECFSPSCKPAKGWKIFIFGSF